MEYYNQGLPPKCYETRNYPQRGYPHPYAGLQVVVFPWTPVYSLGKLLTGYNLDDGRSLTVPSAEEGARQT